MEFLSINPRTEEVIARYPQIKNKELFIQLNQSYEEQKNWANKDLSERLMLFKGLKDDILSDIDKHAQMISLEMGKLESEAKAEVEKCAFLIDTYLDNVKAWSKIQSIEMDNGEHEIHFESLGVILSIMPWNFPYWQVFRFAIPALMMGNFILLKHAPNVLGCAALLEELFKKHLPENAFKSIHANHDQVEELIKRPQLKAVTFTGSTIAGTKVMEVCGRYLKKSVLELGGSDPFIVFSDAKIDEAVKQGTTSRLLNAGQSCIAAKRFLLHQDIYEDFKTKLLKSFEEHELAPLVNDRAVNRLNELLEDARMKGAKITRIEREEKEEKGYYFDPVIVENVNDRMKIYSEEAFGPVAVLYSFKEEKEAIELSNATEFGLAASLWTEDRERAKKLAKQIDCGNVFINSFVKSDPRLPFGGVKNSGVGRELGEFGLKEFVNIKTYNTY